MEDFFNLSLDFTDEHLIHSEDGILHTGGYWTFYTKMEFIELIYFINIRSTTESVMKYWTKKEA